MPYSHHSHSGSYCRHAKNTLDSVVGTAIKKKFEVFCLTEHMPRLSRDVMYPEEADLSVQDLSDTFQAYMQHARALQKVVNDDKGNKTRLLVGFETEGGIDREHLDLALKLRQDFKADLIVGSVHHLDGVDIDFDRERWMNALEKVGHNDYQTLYLRYFETVLNMIKVLKPEIVAHFDLIRLFDVENKGIDIETQWPAVWKVIEQCVQETVQLDSFVELNSAAVRKGWDTAYPKDDIMKYMISQGVKFCLSDDSHGDEQIGLNYHVVLQNLQRKHKGLNSLWFLDIGDDGLVVKRETSLVEICKLWNV